MGATANSSTVYYKLTLENLKPTKFDDFWITFKSRRLNGEITKTKADCKEITDTYIVVKLYQEDTAKLIPGTNVEIQIKFYLKDTHDVIPTETKEVLVNEILNSNLYPWDGGEVPEPEGPIDYNSLGHLPSINDVKLQGNKTLEELGLGNITELRIINSIEELVKPGNENYLYILKDEEIYIWDERTYDYQPILPHVNFEDYYTKTEVDKVQDETKEYIKSYNTSWINSITKSFGTKDYIKDEDNKVLEAAKKYADENNPDLEPYETIASNDEKLKNTLNKSKEFTIEKVTGLETTLEVDRKDAEVLRQAKEYTNQYTPDMSNYYDKAEVERRDQVVLDKAKTYTDKFKPDLSNYNTRDEINAKDEMVLNQAKEYADSKKASVSYASFTIDPKTGRLVMTYTEDYTRPMFKLNERGHLEVDFND